MSHDVNVWVLLAQANFGKIKEVLKELKHRRKTGERHRKFGKSSTLEKGKATCEAK
jgi:hypothetical protein